MNNVIFIYRLADKYCVDRFLAGKPTQSCKEVHVPLSKVPSEVRQVMVTYYGRPWITSDNDFLCILESLYGYGDVFFDSDPFADGRFDWAAILNILNEAICRSKNFAGSSVKLQYNIKRESGDD